MSSIYGGGWTDPISLTTFILDIITVGLFVYCLVASFKSRWKHDNRPDRLLILLYRIGIGAGLIYLLIVISLNIVTNVNGPPMLYNLSVYIVYIFIDLASRVSDFLLLAVILRSCHEELYSYQKGTRGHLAWRKMSIYGLAATLVASVLSWCFVVKYYSEIIKLGYGTTSTAAEIAFADGVYIHWSRVWTIVDLIYLSFYFLLTIPICRAATKPSNRSNMDRPSRRHWALLGISLPLRYLLHIPLEAASQLTFTYSYGAQAGGFADQIIWALLSPWPYFALARLGKRGAGYSLGVGPDGSTQSMLSTPYADLPPLTGLEKYSVANLRRQSSAGRGLSPTPSRESGVSTKRKPVPSGSWQDEPYWDSNSSFSDLGLASTRSRTLELPDPNYHARPGYRSRQTDDLLP